MADTTFVNNVTLTDSDWFNDLNRLHYTIFNDPADFDSAINPLSAHNLGLSATGSGGVLTINLTTKSGATPSSSSPVYIPFRSTTASSGVISVLTVTSATSLTLSSGSTLGITSGNAARVWVVGFNDGGTFRLGAVNVYQSGVNPRILTLDAERTIRSSTAEGGAGGADLAQTIYTGTAVTGKAYYVLGYLEWSPLTTAGTWTTPNTIVVATPRTPMPGAVVADDTSILNNLDSGAGVIPNDNTIPQSSEGTQFVILGTAPRSSANMRLVTFVGNFASSNTDTGIQVALFTGYSTLSSWNANAVATVRFGRSAAANAPANGTLMYLQGPHIPSSQGVGSEDNFMIAAGTASAGTTTFNGAAGASLYNGTYTSFVRIVEIQA